MSSRVTERVSVQSVSPMVISSKVRRKGCAGPSVSAAEGMRVLADLGRAGQPLAGDLGDHIGAALHGGALHVMQHAAHAAQFLAAARASGPAMHQMGQGGAVARRLCHGGPVGDVDPTVPGGTLQRDDPRHLRILCDQRRDQRPAAAIGQRGCMGQVAIRHQGRDRAERFDCVHRRGRVGIVAAQKGGSEKPGPVRELF